MNIETVTSIVELMERDTAVLTSFLGNISDDPERSEEYVLVLVRHCEMIIGSIRDKCGYVNSLLFKYRSIEEHREIYELNGY